MAVDRNGNILIADTGNGRIEKFSPTGTFLTSIGKLEAPMESQLIATATFTSKMAPDTALQKLGPDGNSSLEWAALAFMGHVDIPIGPDDSIYVVDSGHNRIVKFSPDGQVLASWGTCEGSGDGQFKGLSSVAIDPTNNKLYVADPLNSRIQVFDSNGTFLTKWSIPEWGQR